MRESELTRESEFVESQQRTRRFELVLAARCAMGESVILGVGWVLMAVIAAGF